MTGDGGRVSVIAGASRAAATATGATAPGSKLSSPTAASWGGSPPPHGCRAQLVCGWGHAVEWSEAERGHFCRYTRRCTRGRARPDQAERPVTRPVTPVAGNYVSSRVRQRSLFFWEAPDRSARTARGVPL